MKSTRKYAQWVAVFVAVTIVVLAIFYTNNKAHPREPVTNDEMLNNIQANKAILIDVRTPEEYEAGHLKFAKNIDLHSRDFTVQVQQLDKEKTVYLYCRSGGRSKKALDTLKSLGFKSAYNIGGFENLAQNGFPSQN